MLKHLPGRHRQDTHGRRLGPSIDIAGSPLYTTLPYTEPNIAGLSDLVSKYGHKGAQEVLDLYDQKISGLTVRLTEFDPKMPNKIHFSIRGEDGRDAGTGSRKFYKYQVDHTHLNIYSNYQGKGFGTEFYRRSEEVYRKLDIRSVTMDAGHSAGGYVWPLMGFDFANNVAREEIVEQALQVCYDLGFEINEKEIPEHAYEIAAMTVAGWRIDEDGIKKTIDRRSDPMHVPEDFLDEKGDLLLGKLILMGTSWMATKYLDDEESNRVGELYYNHRKKRLAEMEKRA